MSKKQKTVEFKGQQYYDDRLFVLYLVPGTVVGSGDFIRTTIYHTNPPHDHVWCLATYRNYGRYPLYRIDSFYKKEDAEVYQRLIEPQTPLISYGGVIPTPIPSYESYREWKKGTQLKDYEWEKLYSSDGTNQSESIMQTKEQFHGIK